VLVRYEESEATIKREKRGAALFEAADRGEADEVERLLAQGGEPDWRGVAGRTPLLAAAKGGFVGCLDQLIAAGAKVDLANEHGVAPAHLAAAFGHLDCLRALISAGADTRQRDHSGRDALAWAKTGKHKAAAALVKEAEQGRRSWAVAAV